MKMTLFFIFLNLSTLLGFVPVIETFRISQLKYENDSLIFKYIILYFEVDKIMNFKYQLYCRKCVCLFIHFQHYRHWRIHMLFMLCKFKKYYPNFIFSPERTAIAVFIKTYPSKQFSSLSGIWLF
jgi:hypothetical protein